MHNGEHPPPPRIKFHRSSVPPSQLYGRLRLRSAHTRDLTGSRTASRTSSHRLRTSRQLGRGSPGLTRRCLGTRANLYGKVQGVWFRAGPAARPRLGLRGWVRNRADGSVEAVFAGTVGGPDDDRRVPPGRRRPGSSGSRRAGELSGAAGFRQLPSLLTVDKTDGEDERCCEDRNRHAISPSSARVGAGWRRLRAVGMRSCGRGLARRRESLQRLRKGYADRNPRDRVRRPRRSCRSRAGSSLPSRSRSSPPTATSRPARTSGRTTCWSAPASNQRRRQGHARRGRGPRRQAGRGGARRATTTTPSAR